MQITRKDNSTNKVTLTISGSQQDLALVKDHVLEHFRSRVNVPGFRSGKAPLNVIEKHADQNALHAEFIDEALNRLYQKAYIEERLRPVDNPKIKLTKFVPYSELEFEAEVDVLGPIKLGDYKKVKKQKTKVEVTTKDIDEVLDSLKQRSAERKEVERVAKNGDEVVIDFKGVNEKKEPINGADGKNYPLMLGSNTFIPGFEDNVIGLKPGAEKTFTLTFPKDYGVRALANKKVVFTVKVKKVNELKEPKIDNEFAAKVGPFKTVAELKADIKKQLGVEKQNQADRKLENEIIQEVVAKSTVNLPDTLVDEQVEQLKTEIRQNLTYRGQTWQEMLDNEGVNEDEYIKKQLRPEAEQRVKTGLVLAEISIEEKLEVTPEELEVRMQILKGQYTDAAMQTELEKPEARRDIASRLLTEKTVQHLVKLAISK